MLDYLTAAVDIIYPRRCGSCGTPGLTVCPDCLDSFLLVDASTSCPLCGRDVGFPLTCGACASRNLHFSAAHFGFWFSDRFRDALLAFKFRGRKDVGRFLVVLLKKKFEPLSSHIDIIVPLPGTQRRLRERGFSQTFLLSQEISRIMDRPVEYRSLIKSRETRDQYTLNRDERKKNLLGAFSVVNDQAVKGKRILLVDDLFTTGNTAYEASKMLKRAKAQRVEVFALARTP